MADRANAEQETGALRAIIKGRSPKAFCAMLSSSAMLVIRPITLPDLDQLEALTAFTGYGLTTLPRDTQLLRRRIRE